MKKPPVRAMRGRPKKSSKKFTGRRKTCELGAVQKGNRGLWELHPRQASAHLLFLGEPHERGGACAPRWRLLSDCPSRLDLTLCRSLDELATAIQNRTRLLIAQSEGFLNLGASDRTLFSDELSDLVSEFSVCDLRLCRLVALVVLLLVEQFNLVTAEGDDFSVVSADLRNLVQHFSLCHVNHLLPFLHS